MSSVIHYKFKNASKRFDVIQFDGNVMTVADLKRQIIREKKLGKADDVDLLVTNAQTGEDYRDDGFMVSKNTSVIVRRVPSMRARPVRVALPDAPIDVEAEAAAAAPAADAHGAAAAPVPTAAAAVVAAPVSAPAPASYGVGAVSTDVQPQNSNGVSYGYMPRGMDDGFGDSIFGGGAPAAGAAESGNEEAQFAALQKQASSFTQALPVQTQRQGVDRHMDRTLPNQKPPPGYICHRCSKPGHFIRNCPTNSDPNYDFKTKNVMNRPIGAGLPRSFIQKIEDPKGLDAPPGTGPAQANPGNHVAGPVHQPAHNPYAQYQRPVTQPGYGPARMSAGDEYLAQPAVAPSRERLRADLTCPYGGDHHFRNATVTSCCHKSWCDECIRQQLVNNDFKCPTCGKPINPDIDLKPNKFL